LAFDKMKNLNFPSNANTKKKINKKMVELK
jgi:hypothetical protein